MDNSSKTKSKIPASRKIMPLADKKAKRPMPKYPSEKDYNGQKSLQSRPVHNIVAVSPKYGNVASAYSAVGLYNMKNIKTKQLKHQHITSRISSEILSGKLQPGQKIPTEHELARAFNASRPTIGKALRELQEQGLINRKQGSGSFVSVPRNEGCKIGALMGFSHDDANSGIFGRLLSEVSHICTLNDCSFVMTNYPVGDDEEIHIRHAKKTCIELIKQGVDAILFMPIDLSPQNENVNHEIAEDIKKAGITLVLLDRDIYKTPKRSKYDRVGANNELAAQMLTQHLINHGASKIDMIGCLEMPPSVKERMDGYQKAMIENGMEPKKEQYHKVDSHNLATVNECLEVTQADALICINDEVAALVMRSLLQRGVRIPQDMKIVGFDDLPISSLLPAPLTTVRQPVKDIAHEAFRTILTRLEDPDMPAKDVLLTAELVVRESCGTVANKTTIVCKSTETHGLKSSDC